MHCSSTTRRQPILVGRLDEMELYPSSDVLLNCSFASPPLKQRRSTGISVRPIFSILTCRFQGAHDRLMAIRQSTGMPTKLAPSSIAYEGFEQAFHRSLPCVKDVFPVDYEHKIDICVDDIEYATAHMLL